MAEAFFLTDCCIIQELCTAAEGHHRCARANFVFAGGLYRSKIIIHASRGIKGSLRVCGQNTP